MKKLLLITGAVYGIYMIIKKLGLANNNSDFTSGNEGTRDGFANGGRTRNNVKMHAHHGDIRGIMKKASGISHNLETA